MESLKVEELEEVEKDDFVPEKEEKPAEYELLLLAENNRQAYEKAVNLVKFGCFKQEEIAEIDFNKYEKIEGKKYKGLYDLYRNVETMELVFICPLVEANKADLENTKELAPYAYDCIITNAMDEETYQMVCVAAKNNLHGVTRTLYITAYVLYFVLIASAIITYLWGFIYTMDSAATQTFNVRLSVSVINAAYYSGALFAGVVIATPLLVLMRIKYKNQGK